MAKKKRAKSKARPTKKNTKVQKKAKKGKASERDELAARQHNQRCAVFQFAAAILIACFVLIEGDNVWRWVHNFFLGLFGNCAILWPILLLYISIVTALEKQPEHSGTKISLMAVIIILFCAAVYVFTIPLSAQTSANLKSISKQLISLYGSEISHTAAGLCGGLLGIPLAAAFGIIGTRILLVLALFVSIMVLTRTTLMQLFRTIFRPANAVVSNISVMRERRVERNRKETNIDIPLDDDMPAHPVHSYVPKADVPKKSTKLEQLKKVFSIKTNLKTESSGDASHSGTPEMQPGEKSEIVKSQAHTNINPDALPQPVKIDKHDSASASYGRNGLQPAEEPPSDGKYHFPPVSMLETTKAANEKEILSEVQINGRRLVDTLKSFGVQTTFVGYSRGPAVTRYELQPAAGVKISRITNLSDDISMNLATAGIRIEAPIPGKAAVGIEVPNKKTTVVRMRELVESNSFAASKSKLTVALGRDLAGETAIADLAKMPHLLIAGATGSGKSVCINSMIISLLYKSTPDEVRFLMIDPKVVELGVYNGIPQLLVPVVTDPRKAAGALNWAVTEMLKRYKTFAKYSVRDLTAYNELAASHGYKNDESQPMEKMPQIVIIIDELADLMMAAPNEVEDAICRLAQMARAAGMHLVIATQRPSVDVITGTIKANIPSRIAFAVSSQVDSRTIIDMGGAEKLLGHGDMLFSPVGSQKPKRIQGCFVSDSEIESIAGFIKKSQQADYNENIAEEIEKNAAADNDKKSDSNVDKDTDPMMPEAIKCVIDNGQASTSLLQRRLRLGYARAGRLIDEMEQMGIIGPRDGSKPRQVLITYQQWLERNMKENGAADKDGSMPETKR